METTVCQRWESGRHRWRPAGEPFDPRRFEVGPVPAADAKAFVRAHHYSRSCCSLVRRHGLYAAGALVGVARFADVAARFSRATSAARRPKASSASAHADGPLFARARGRAG